MFTHKKNLLFLRCSTGHYITHLAVRGMKDYGTNIDDYGATNVKVVCSDNETVQGKGGEEGEWTDLVRCPSHMKICGLRAKIQQYKRNQDNTALNRIQLQCCKNENAGTYFQRIYFSDFCILLTLLTKLLSLVMSLKK